MQIYCVYVYYATDLVIASMLRLRYYTAMPITRLLDAEAALRAAGLRATPGRSKILTVLAKETQPLSIESIRARTGNTLNSVTLYRALEALADAGIVTRADMQHGHAHYELSAGRKHHHHVICRDCGRVEDIEATHATQPEREALRRTKGFASIDDYALEFFGTCVRCASRHTLQ